MCYTKEVSLVTSGVIFTSTIFTWVKYYLGKANAKIRNLDPRVHGFIKYTIIGFALIGGHQLFEFLSIWSGSQIVYKIGLLISISYTYFLLLALEKLTRRAFGSQLYPVVIAALGVYMFNTNMTFSEAHFYVRGNSHLVWSLTWMILFIYWNLCVVTVAVQLRDKFNRRLLFLYPWVFTNFSYLLMLGYVFMAYAYLGSPVIASVITCAGLADTLKDYSFQKDIASIWCAFAAVAVIFIPTFFGAMVEKFKAADLSHVKSFTFQRAAAYLAASAAILFFLYTVLPAMIYVGFKMVTK